MNEEITPKQLELTLHHLIEEVIPRICHEANRAYCESFGDDSQVPWDHAPQWQKDSCRLGVKFNLDNPDAPASASHESWLAVKAAEGWKYGPVKDVEKKEHPCFVPYDQLPEMQRVKDHIFKNIVMSFIPFLPDQPVEEKLG